MRAGGIRIGLALNGVGPRSQKIMLPVEIDYRELLRVEVGKVRHELATSAIGSVTALQFT